MFSMKFSANGDIIKKSNKTRKYEYMSDVSSNTTEENPQAVNSLNTQLDYLNLAGNLKLAGSIRATNFYKEDGTELPVVAKLALPDNFYYIDKKLGINRENPTYDLDINGNTRMSGNLYIDNNLLSKGSTMFGGPVIAEDSFLANKNFNVTGESRFRGPVIAEDSFLANKNFNVTGESRFKGPVIAEDSFLANKNFNVTGESRFKGPVIADDSFLANKNFNVTGESRFRGPVIAEDSFLANKNFNVTGESQFKGPVIADDNVLANKNFHVTGESQFKGPVIAEDNVLANKNFHVTGESQFKGPVIAEDKITANELYMRNAIFVGDQNIAHPDTKDGAFYRADGQVQIASDDFIRMRDIGSKSTGIQFDLRDSNNSDIRNPGSELKISRQGLIFGGTNSGRETNSAQISAGLHVPNSLNIVGMSSDNNAANRQVDMWAEKGFTLYGNQTVGGNMVVGNGSTTNARDLPGHINLSVEHSGDSHIRMKTKNDDAKNIYMINRDGNFRVHMDGVGDVLGVNHNGNFYTTGSENTFNGAIKTPGGHTFSCAGRQHMTGEELLYILHKNGAVIGKEWGGNGNLSVQGNLSTAGESAVAGKLTAAGELAVGDKLCIGTTCMNKNNLDAFFRLANSLLVRYIRIGNEFGGNLLNEQTRAWTINHVKVYDFDNNVVSIGKPVTLVMGQRYADFSSNERLQQVTAASYNTNLNSGENLVWHGDKDNSKTAANDFHIIEIDLQGQFPISKIELFGRKDCCFDRLNGTSIDLLNNSRQTLRRILTGTWNQEQSRTGKTFVLS